MADDYGFSSSQQTDSGLVNPDPAAPATDEELIAFPHCDRVELGQTGTLLLNRRNGKQVIVAPEVATALTYCGSFKTLPDHATTLVTRLPQLKGQLEDVTKVLSMIRDSGLMLSASEVCRQLAEVGESTRSQAPTRVCIITCDRPAALERLLDSMLRTTTLSSHDELFLVDDSRLPENLDQNRELVARFNLTSSKNMNYLGPREQQSLHRKLVSALPGQEQAISSLIDRQRWSGQKTYGLSRTLCLLLTVGYRCIVLDDDILCASVRPPVESSGLSFGGGSSRELDCYESEQALMQAANFGDSDPLAGHASYLGMLLGQALPTLTGGALTAGDLRHVNAAMIETLAGDSPILISQCGSWGDPGTVGNSWLYHLDKDSLSRLLSMPGGLAQAMENRHYWLGRPRPNISKMAIMSQATGLDNSQLLPPYFPAFRGEDALFASMVLCLHPASAVIDHAWSVPHLPIEKRGSDGNNDQVDPGQVVLSMLARYLADRVSYQSGTLASTRLQHLALNLRDLGEREDQDLMGEFRKEMAKQQAEQMQRLSAQVQAAANLGSKDWQAFVQQGLNQVSKAVQIPASPANLGTTRSDLSETELLARAKSMLLEFSNTLLGWPKIRQAAREVVDGMLQVGELTP